MVKKKTKIEISGWGIFGLICLAFVLIGVGSCSYDTYMRNSYDYPVHIQEALSKKKFEKAYKIIGKWTKYRGQGWFNDKEKAKIDSYKEIVLSEEIRLAILNGELNRVEDIASWREGGLERLPRILQSQKMLIFSRLKMVDESTLKALCSYMNTSELMGAYIEAVDGNKSMILSFISGLSIGRDSATTGAIVGKDVLDANMRYIQGIERYNDACNVALDYAISVKDKDFAQKIVTMFKRTLDVIVSNDKWFTKEDEYYYMYSDKPIEEAKRKYEMAF